MVARLELCHLWTNCFDDSSSFVTKDGRGGKRVKAIDEVQITMAHAACHGAHQYFTPDGLCDVNVFNSQWEGPN
jgi:hypothetical protein